MNSNVDQRQTKDKKPKQFDAQTLYCVIKGRLNMGEDPQSIFNELKNLPVVDIDSLRLLLKGVKEQGSHYFDSEARGEVIPIKTTREFD